MTFYSNAKSTVWQKNLGGPITRDDFVRDGIDGLPERGWAMAGE